MSQEFPAQLIEADRASLQCQRLGCDSGRGLAAVQGASQAAREDGGPGIPIYIGAKQIFAAANRFELQTISGPRHTGINPNYSVIGGPVGGGGIAKR